MPARENIFRLSLAVLAAILLLGSPSSAFAESVSLRATLILASNDPSAQDARLEEVEYKLRRVFGFEYYRHYGETSAIVNLPGTTSLALGHGNRIELQLSGSSDRLRAQVQWYRNDAMVLNTTVAMDRRAPVVLGGVSHENGTLIVTLKAE